MDFGHLEGVPRWPSLGDLRSPLLCKCYLTTYFILGWSSKWLLTCSSPLLLIGSFALQTKKTMVHNSEKKRLQSGWIFVGFFWFSVSWGWRFNKWGARQATLMIVFYKIYNKKDQFSEYFFWGGWVDFVLKCLCFRRRAALKLFLFRRYRTMENPPFFEDVFPIFKPVIFFGHVS